MLQSPTAGGTTGCDQYTHAHTHTFVAQTCLRFSAQLQRGSAGQLCNWVAGMCLTRFLARLLAALARPMTELEDARKAGKSEQKALLFLTDGLTSLC